MKCSYCGVAPAIHFDHIVSKHDRRRYGIAADDQRYIAPSCGPDNWRKLTRRLIPPTHAHLLDELNALMTGPRWQIWDGGKLPEVVR